MSLKPEEFRKEQKGATLSIMEPHAMRTYPKRGEVYTLTQIYNELYLRDTPCLRVNTHQGVTSLQDQWSTVDEVLSDPVVAASKWRYNRETIEWIPVFDSVEPDVLDLTVELATEEGDTVLVFRSQKDEIARHLVLA